MKKPHPFLIFSQSDYLIMVVDIYSYTEWQTVQIQISWLLQKPTDLDLHCLQGRVCPGSAGQGLSNKDFGNFFFMKKYFFFFFLLFFTGFKSLMLTS